MENLISAIKNAGLELLITLIISWILFCLAWFIRDFSLKKQLEAFKSVAESNQQEIVQKEFNVNFWQGISTELFGAVITTLSFGIIILIFQQYSIIESRKNELIIQLGSPVNDISLEAVRQLDILGYLTDGTLAGSYLWQANLSDGFLVEAKLNNIFASRANFDRAQLGYANLSNANLYAASFVNSIIYNANLSGSEMSFIDFHQAQLVRVDLSDAFLFYANLSNANLGCDVVHSSEGTFSRGSEPSETCTNLTNTSLAGSNLTNANLEDAILIGANLEDAMLVGANLNNTLFDEATILPNGSHWTPNVDLSIFTDPNHPEYWDTCVENIGDLLLEFCNFERP